MKRIEKDILAAKKILDRQRPPKSARLWKFDDDGEPVLYDNGELVRLCDYAKRAPKKRGKK
jgi:hypothetical protein